MVGGFMEIQPTNMVDVSNSFVGNNRDPTRKKTRNFTIAPLNCELLNKDNQQWLHHTRFVTQLMSFLLLQYIAIIWIASKILGQSCGNSM